MLNIDLSSNSFKIRNSYTDKWCGPLRFCPFPFCSLFLFLCFVFCFYFLNGCVLLDLKHVENHFEGKEARKSKPKTKTNSRSTLAKNLTFV